MTAYLVLCSMAKMSWWREVMASDLRFGLQNPGETAYKAQSSNRDILSLSHVYVGFLH